MSTMKPAVVILFCAASAASAAFVDLDNWWDSKPDLPVVKNDNSQITGWLGQVPMFEAISKRNAITDLLKKLAEENKGLKPWQINPHKYLTSKRSDPIWWEGFLNNQQNKKDDYLKDHIMMSKRIVAFDNGLESKSWTSKLWDSLFGSDKPKDKFTGVGGLGPLVMSKRCMTIKKPDSWYMKVFGYVPKDAGKPDLDANGLPKTRCG